MRLQDIQDIQDVAPLPAAAARIDGHDGTASPQRSDRTDAGGNSVQVDGLHEARDLSIRRERTWHTDDRNGAPVQTGDQVVVETGDDDDRVEVRTNADDGTTDIYVNGERYPVTLVPGQEITLRTGGGNDTIFVGSDVTVNIVVEAGDGDDFVMTGAGDDRIDAGAGDDVVYAGEGRDDVFGNSGNDRLSGGAGNDVVYGGDGDDFMTGTTGDDYLEGGAGADTLWGGAGNDILSGGRGNDRIEGDGGDDVVYAGLGNDSIVSHGGTDTVYAQADTGEDTVTISEYAAEGTTNTVVNVVVSKSTGATVEGSDAFVQRVEADLDMMRASPLGQQLFADLDASGRSVVITETTDQNGYAGYSNPGDRFATPTGPGPGTDVEIGYNPSFHTDMRGSGYGFPVPAITLYHELSHAWNGVTGTSQPGTHAEGVDTGQNNRERQAVGLPTQPSAGGPNPEYATENGIRGEMGLPDRPSYAAS